MYNWYVCFSSRSTIIHKLSLQMSLGVLKHTVKRCLPCANVFVTVQYNLERRNSAPRGIMQGSFNTVYPSLQMGLVVLKHTAKLCLPGGGGLLPCGKKSITIR